jgi:hypothetical protein
LQRLNGEKHHHQYAGLQLIERVASSTETSRSNCWILRDGIAIVQQVRVSLLVSHRLSQLLSRPLRRRMRCHVRVISRGL